MNIVLFGPPGAGKGTQAHSICSQFEIQHISTGDLLRKAIKDQSKLGIEAQALVQAGQLVPDLVVIGIIRETILNSTAKGFLFDGFPRTVAQAQALDELFMVQNLKLNKAVFLEVNKKHLIERLSGRRVCSKCGTSFHIIMKPSLVQNICDVCGGILEQRPDDKIEVIENRLNVYEKNTLPLKDFYKNEKKFILVNGEGTPEQVFARINSAVRE